ncbi:polysaccharide biosynthesis protein [bacterium]|nr:polysaccharide biosynthesis protein [candidate division CSSED10-310 bacterium]
MSFPSIRNGQTNWRTWYRPVLIRSSQLGIDVILMTVSFLLAYLVRFECLLSQQNYRLFQTQLPWVLSIQLIMYFIVGLNSFIWRFIGMREVKYFLMHSLFTVLPMILFRLLLTNRFQGYRIPISIILMTGILTFLSLLGIRLLRRYFYERRLDARNTEWIHETVDETGDDAVASKASAWPKVLLVGAGRAGSKAAEALQVNPRMRLNLVGFVDDDQTKRGMRVRDLKILGSTDDLPRLVKKLDVEQVIITISTATRDQLRRITAQCEAIPVKVRMIPGFADIVSGRHTVNMIRDVQIEDILGRDSVHLDEDPIRAFIEGKSVLVTGAGGSIGSELVRQAHRFKARQILLVERCEYALYTIHCEMCGMEMDHSIDIVPLVADVCDEFRINEIFEKYRPNLVLHAAAHKHVPMMEFNPGEAIKNNVMGTHTLTELSAVHGVEAFVLISTDKAVNPTSIMGASKRLAEWVVQSYNGACATRFIAVRFGNVLGSTGSVIPLFKRQIVQGGPVTVTHLEMERYFMTIPEAVQLVLQAGAMGHGGEIFILDMGQPIKIIEMAERMIRLSGLRPYKDIPIECTGIRPGEKLFEELNTREENADKTKHPKIFVGKLAPLSRSTVKEMLANLHEGLKKADTPILIQIVSEMIPEAELSILPKQ